MENGIKNIDIEKNKELFEYEMTEVILKLKGEFAVFSGKDTKFEEKAVDEKKLQVNIPEVTQIKVKKHNIETPEIGNVNLDKTSKVSEERITLNLPRVAKISNQETQAIECKFLTKKINRWRQIKSFEKIPKVFVVERKKSLPNSKVVDVPKVDFTKCVLKNICNVKYTNKKIDYPEVLSLMDIEMKKVESSISTKPVNVKQLQEYTFAIKNPEVAKIKLAVPETGDIQRREIDYVEVKNPSIVVPRIISMDVEQKNMDKVPVSLKVSLPLEIKNPALTIQVQNKVTKVFEDFKKTTYPSLKVIDFSKIKMKTNLTTLSATSFDEINVPQKPEVDTIVDNIISLVKTNR